MKYRISISIVALLISVLIGCASMYQTSRQGKQYPTFRIGEFSWDAMIFKDTVLYRQSFSDGGGMLSDVFPIGNWRFINDTTLECYNLRPRKKTESTVKIYHLDRIDSLTQLLIPEKSLTFYRDSLQARFHAWITIPYQVTAEDKLMIKSDSVRAYRILLTDHREKLISKYKRKFNELGIYNGNGF